MIHLQSIKVISHVTQKLFVLLLLKAFAIALVLFYAGLGLSPDEAQYWTWSQKLDFGYYSKPPAIAWQIWLGTTLFGNTELGVRALSLVIGTILPLLLFKLAKDLKTSSIGAYLAAVAFAFSPIGIFSSILAITDGGMILFWTVALYFLLRDMNKNKCPNYLLIGGSIAIGALFKWPIYFFWVLIIPSALYFKVLRSWKILSGILFSLLGLIPSLYWNIKHDFATFKHVQATLLKDAYSTSSGNFFDFLGAEVALVSPVLFILILLTLWHLKKSQAAKFSAYMTSAIFTFGAFLSIFTKVQGNWIIFAYPSAFLLLAYASPYQKFIKFGVIVSLVLTSFVLSIPSLPSFPYKINPFKHNVGWDNVKSALQKAGYNPEKDLLFSDTYQGASILSFYGQKQHLAYFFNLKRCRKNQFSYWPKMPVIDEDANFGKAYFVVFENKQPQELITLIQFYEKQLTPYFDEVKTVGIFPLFKVKEIAEKNALIIKCERYNGKVPAESNKF